MAIDEEKKRAMVEEEKRLAKLSSLSSIESDGNVEVNE